MGKVDRTLTLDQVREEPLALLNAEEAELRALFGEVLERRQDAAAAVQFVAAWRAVFELATAATRDLPAEAKTFMREVRPCWMQHAPWIQRLPMVEIVHGAARDDEPCELVYLKSGEPTQDRSPVWRCLDDPDALGLAEAAAAGRPAAWDVLWRAYRQERVGRCKECGALFRRADTGRPRLFCSGPCRKRFHDRRRKA